MKTARTKLLYLAMFAVIAAPCAVAYVGMKPILQLLVISILALFLGGRLVLYSVAWSFLLTAIPTGLLLVAGTTAISIKLLLAADPPRQIVAHDSLLLRRSIEYHLLAVATLISNVARSAQQMLGAEGQPHTPSA